MKSLSQHINESFDVKTDMTASYVDNLADFEKAVNDLTKHGAKIKKWPSPTSLNVKYDITLPSNDTVKLSYTESTAYSSDYFVELATYGGHTEMYYASNKKEVASNISKKKDFYKVSFNTIMSRIEAIKSKIADAANKTIAENGRCKCILDANFSSSNMKFNKGFDYSYEYKQKYDSVSVSYDDGRFVTMSSETFFKHFKTI